MQIRTEIIVKQADFKFPEIKFQQSIIFGINLAATAFTTKYPAALTAAGLNLFSANHLYQTTDCISPKLSL